MSNHEFTVREFAQRERVTTRTVWRWVDKGAVPVRRTPSGRIRIVQIAARQTATSRDITGQSVK